MPTRLCAEPGCPNPAATRGRCPTHARTNDKAINRAGHHIYRTTRWQRLRRRVLFEQPICAGCDNELAVDVHHRVDIADGGNPWARSNLEALCKSCHSKLTRHHQQTQT
jgi:5-methylcytosine-specific restriction enzyme A